MSKNNIDKKRVLIFAAHPDDEVLGCGGTIAYHRSRGDSVGVCYLSEGVSSRLSFKNFEDKSFWHRDLEEREKMARNAQCLA